MQNGLTFTTNTDTTYSTSVVDGTPIKLRLSAGGSGSGTDDIDIVGGTNVTVARTDASTITISSTDTDTVYTHPNHSGEVTSTADGATVIVSNIVDEDNLKISNAGSDGEFLSKQSGNTGGLTWATPTDTNTQLSDAQVVAALNSDLGGDVVFGTDTGHNVKYSGTM